MSNVIAGKAELHRLVDTLTDLQAIHILDEIQSLLAAADTLTEAEAADAALGAEEIARGDYVTLDEMKHELAPREQAATPEQHERESSGAIASAGVKDEIHQLVDELDERAAEEVLDFLRWLTSEEEEELTDEEYARVLEGEAAAARGEVISWSDLKRSLHL